MPLTDLVLEGGGAKLPGLVGAVNALTSADYSIHRIAGTSAGAIVGALATAGIPPERLTETILGKDFTDFEDLSPAFRFTPWLGKVQGLLFHKGMYLGTALHDFLDDILTAQGIRTWADLRLHDPESALPPERQYRLVVIVSDVSRGRMLRLPWDYRPALGVDPDSQSVADAVCASAAMPFYFRPRSLPADRRIAGGSSVLGSDGGLLSNFPVDLFDRKDQRPARWPTLGVMLSARTTAGAQWRPNANTYQYAVSLLSTMINAHDRRHIDEPSITERTIFVDTDRHSSTDFALSRGDKLDLIDSGANAARSFLKRWDWLEWKEHHGRR
ncbi:patatin-like phospholipase family protein [Brevibacterium aurantiacum]|uniref:Patatin-like phospholipase family protein n=1 Tax=Brevibacterium aurantiacum TaxID=273384 RepID=A0A556CI63_BREAU|nr:patatin-like phospholipase family protein [Brevibacterium aurantiacum]TSI17006.1 patatin-like phospholipase family protein [Brevibacterium aurantiacum]